MPVGISSRLPRVPISAPIAYQRIERVVLTDEVSRNLFAEYATHLNSERGNEEIGWVLMGQRTPQEVLVLATLPAGANRDAGAEHVQFNSDAQALAARIVRQRGKNLGIVGVVHTQPGSMRHPSAADYRGDRVWVKNLKGNEGVFAIGTMDAESGHASEALGHQPTPSAQALGQLRFDWYTLGANDRNYQDVPAVLTLGPDWATPLRPIWPIIEEHATRLDKLASQFKTVEFEVPSSEIGTLRVRIRLSEAGQAIHLVLHEKTVRCLYEADGEVFQPDLPAGLAPDHGVYQILAELAARS